MFALFEKEQEQKDLFFQLKQYMQYDKQKLAGIYAIFKDDICLYVGQSKNIPSRLATHLNGKYKIADTIFVFHDDADIDDLLPSEKYLIKHLKPIENVLVNFTEDIETSELIHTFYDYEKGAFKDLMDWFSYKIVNDTNELFICDDSVPLNLLENKKARDYIKETISHVEDHENERG